MYCNACGKPNHDDSAFCSSCGKPLTPICASKPTPPPVSQPTPIQPVRQSVLKMTEFQSEFRRAWRGFVTSPLVLALIICHSVAVLLSFIELNTTIESLGGLFDTFGSLGVLNSGKNDSGNFMLSLLQIVVMAPGILIAVGLWMMYIDSLDQSDRPLRVTGLKVILGVEIAALVIYSLYMLVALFASCAAASALNESSYLASSAETALDTIIVVLVLVGAAVIALSWVTVKMIISIRDCAEGCNPDTKYLKGFAIYEFVTGGLSVLCMLAAGLSLSMAVSCGLQFLFGIVLLKYKDLMETLYWKQKKHDTQYEAARTANGLHNQTDYVPAWKRVEMEKKDTSGWACMNCGAHNDSNAVYCIHCGGKERQ